MIKKLDEMIKKKIRERNNAVGFHAVEKLDEEIKFLQEKKIEYELNLLQDTYKRRSK